MNLVTIGGAYIPPARLRMMQEQITDKTRCEILIYLYISPSFYLILYLSLFSLAYQRMSWEALKKSINGLINKVIKMLLPLIM